MRIMLHLDNHPQIFLSPFLGAVALVATAQRTPFRLPAERRRSRSCHLPRRNSAPSNGSSFSSHRPSGSTPMLSLFPPVPCTARPPQLYAVFRFTSMFLLLFSRSSFFLYAQHDIAPRHRCVHCFCIICVVVFHFARSLTCSELVSRVDELIDQAVEKEKKNGVFALLHLCLPMLSRCPRSPRVKSVGTFVTALSPLNHLSHVHDDGVPFHSHNTGSPLFIVLANFSFGLRAQILFWQVLFVVSSSFLQTKKPMPCYL